jgi:hypothetical protein
MVRVNFAPTPPFTFYKEVVLDVEVTSNAHGLATFVAAEVAGFCDGRRELKFGGRRSERRAWEPPSCLRPQQQIMCWVLDTRP